MKIAVVGTGYVGLVAGVCFADAGHYVYCVDKDERKIGMLKKNQIPIYEPGLEDLLRQARSRIEFTTGLPEAVAQCSVIFIAVGTPEKSDGSADMTTTHQVLLDILKVAKEKRFLVLKSTVPVGTAKILQARCDQESLLGHEIVNNPEFLREGSALDDFLHPDRIVIGVKSKMAEDLMRGIYGPFLTNGRPLFVMDNASAEMTKYAANAFLSVKISFINELALLADRVGADIDQVRTGFTSDKRINPAFFYPGVGYGGSCFPKDVKALIHSGEKFGLAMDVVRAADRVNDRQRVVFVQKIRDHFGSLKGKRLALWGLSFKPRTDDVREAPALSIIEDLVNDGAVVVAYDPVAGETARKASRVSFDLADSAMAATRGADALLVVTEWNEFRNPDLVDLKEHLKLAVVFDGRNIFDPEKMRQAGFQYYCFGRESVGC